MADQVDLAARRRAGSGKGEARALRREGRVPAIAYGVGLDATPLSVDARELYHALHTHAGANAIISLQVDGTPHLTLAREVVRHPVRREVLHLDFVAVSRTVKVQVEVPVVLTGEAAGVQEGGIVEQTLFSLNVEVLPLEVPDELPLDISELGIGDVLRVSDVRVPGGVEVLDDAELPVVTIVVPSLDVPETEGGTESAADDFEAGGATADQAQAAAAALEE
jgi:large subunit ribosomal protein L25